MGIEEIPLRSNSQKVEASWFNAIRTYGIGSSANYTAFAGGGQSSATALTTDTCIITVCATSLDSVKLPVSANLKKILVVNDTANTLAIFPQTGEYINALAVNTAYNLGAGTTAFFQASASTKWVSVSGSGSSSTSGADVFLSEDFESGISGYTSSGTFALSTTSSRADTACLNGTKEGKFTRGSSGDTISKSVSIPVGYNPAIVRISFLYETGSSYADNDIEIHVLNGATELGVVGYQLKAGKGKHICEFQTDAATADTTYTLRFKQATAGSWTDVYIDDLTVAAREIARGSVVTDYVAFTPTGAWSTNTTYTGAWRRVGDVMEGWVKIALAGAPTAASLTVNMPSGYSIDTTKADADSDNYTNGLVSIKDNDTGNFYTGAVRYSSSSAFQVMSLDPQSVTRLAMVTLNATAPITFAASDELHIRFRFPIAGWSSNANISSDFGGRVIAASAYRSGNQTGVNPNASAIKININSKTVSGAKGFDTTNSFDATTNFRYDVIETGFYNVKGAINVAGTNVLNNSYYALIKVSGSTTSYGNGFLPQVSQPFTTSVSTLLYLTAGQYVELFLYGAGNNSASTLTVGSGADSTYLEIDKIQSPQTLMGGEVVSACYTTNTAHSFTTGSLLFVDFEDKVWDTHNAVVGAGNGVNATQANTWRFVAPYSGKYKIESGFLMSNQAWTATTELSCGVSVSASTKHITQVYVAATQTYFRSGPIVTTEVDMTAGQVLSIYFTHNEGSTRSMYNDGNYNRITITKVN